MTKVLINKIEKITEIQEKLFWSFVAIVAILAVSYGFLMRDLVVKVVARQNLEKEIVAMSSQVGILETKYFEQKNAITMQTAEQIGFVEAKNINYLSAANVSSNLSLRN
ncbi:MAG: hypothetical protein WCO10_00905 [bacterium]